MPFSTVFDELSWNRQYQLLPLWPLEFIMQDNSSTSRIRTPSMQGNSNTFFPRIEPLTSSTLQHSLQALQDASFCCCPTALSEIAQRLLDCCYSCHVGGLRIIFSALLQGGMDDGPQLNPSDDELGNDEAFMRTRHPLVYIGKTLLINCSRCVRAVSKATLHLLSDFHCSTWCRETTDCLCERWLYMPTRF